MFLLVRLIIHFCKLYQICCCHDYQPYLYFYCTYDVQKSSLALGLFRHPTMFNLYIKSAGSISMTKSGFTVTYN